MKKKVTTASILLCFMFMVTFLYLNYRPVKIMDVHQGKVYSDIIVDHLPLTDKQKIKWWLDNKEMLLNKYNVPKKQADGLFGVYFWEFGDGYKEAGKYDRLCFDDMPEPKNCIDKNNLMIVANMRDGNMEYTFPNATYIQTPEGELHEKNLRFTIN